MKLKIVFFSQFKCDIQNSVYLISCLTLALLKEKRLFPCFRNKRATVMVLFLIHNCDIFLRY